MMDIVRGLNLSVACEKQSLVFQVKEILNALIYWHSLFISNFFSWN